MRGDALPYPSIYDVTYSYTGFAQAQGDGSFPGTQIDADFAGLQDSLANLDTFMRDVIRSDGALNNSIVTFDSLSPSLQTAGLAPGVAWVAATSYPKDTNAIINGKLYRSTVLHTSGVFATDLAAGKWLFVADFPVAAYLAGTGLQLAGLTFSIGTTVATLTGAQALTNKTIDASANTISNLTTTMFAANVVDTDGTLTANSDARVPSQKAVKTFANQVIAAADAMVFKGVINCSANPNYPAADAGWTYKVSVAGKIGGASGSNVEVGDTLYCITDGTASGTQAAVGAQWNIAQVNIDGAVTGPASSTSGNVPSFNGATGKIIQDSGKPISAMPSSAGHMPATPTNDVAASGEVAEYFSSISTGSSGTPTMTIASPAVISEAAHGRNAYTPVTFTTTGALPTGVVAGTTYYVMPGASLLAGSYQIASSIANAAAGVAVNTSGTQSGVHTAAGVANLATSAAKDVAGLLLPAGEWVLGGGVQFTSAGSTSTTFLGQWLSTVSATFSARLDDGYASFNGAAQVGYNSAIACGQKLVRLSVPTVVYLSVLTTFTVSTQTANAFIWARRPR